jgi:hypothetical protein
MSIFDIFRPTTPPAVTAPGNQGGATPGTHSSNVTAPNGVVPSQQVNPNSLEPQSQNQPSAPNLPPSPMSDFKDVWNTPATPQADQGLFGNLDSKALMESARQVDFAKVLKPEQLQAISQGGEAAMKAFAESLNSVAQTVYGQSALATTKIVEQAMAKNKESSDKQMQEMVKKFSVNEGLQANNPLLNNPALAPIVGALTDSLTRKNPSATSAEIQAQVNDYFNQLGTTFAPKPPASVDKNSGRAAKNEDWEKFLLG